MYGSYSYNQYERSDVVTGLSSAVMAEACATSEEAEEADFRDWATSNKISSKAVDMLVKDGFNSMDAIVLLERDDLSSKMPRGQQKLLLKALQSLRPHTSEEATDRGTTADWAAAPVEACVSADNIAGDPSRNATAAPAATTAATTAAIGDVHQHQVGDIYANMMAEHLRSLQTAACDTSRLPVAGTEPGGAINADYTPAWAGLPNFASVGIATAGQRQTSGHGLVSPAATGWQDPQVYLASAAAGKSPGTYHDIVDFVTKDTIDELVVAGVHEGSQLVVKTGSKAKLESITLSQWSIANLAIMYTLLSEGKLISNAVIDYLSYTTKVYQLTQRYENVSVYLYDREYRKLQASHGFRWGTDIPHLHVIQLVPRTPRNDRKLKSLNMSGPQPRPMNIPTGPRTLDGRAICKLYNSPRGCGYVDCKFVHACSHKGCNEVHSATVHFLMK